jgi:hypothetical protein
MILPNLAWQEAVITNVNHHAYPSFDFYAMFGNHWPKSEIDNQWAKSKKTGQIQPSLCFDMARELIMFF